MKQPSGDQVQDHGVILDLTKSIISFQGIPTGGFLAYDIESKKHAHIPTYTLTAAGDYYASKNAIFVEEYDSTVKGNTMNRYNVQRINIEEPKGINKVLEKVHQFAVEGNYLKVDT
ncbi:hypothetical protein [Cytobacillus luteolus]|nr:hypothetical protein [Cytobacillus luteolus]